MLIDGVVVPILHPPAKRTVEFGGDDFDARFHEPSREQALLTPSVAAVAIAHGVAFAAQVKGLPRFGADEHIDRLRLEAIERCISVLLVKAAAHVVKGSQQRFAPRQVVKVLRRRQIVD